MARHFTKASVENLSVQGATDFFGTGGVSFSYWYYHDTVPGSGFPNRQAVLFIGNGTNDNFVVLHDGAAGVGIQVLWTVGANNFFAFEAQNTLDSGKWHHVLIVTDFSSGNSAIYLDGVAQTLAGNWSSPPDQPSSPSYLIAGVNYANEGWDGRLADLALWNNLLLSASDAKALARGIRPNRVRPEKRLRWWPLDGRVLPEPELWAQNGANTKNAALNSGTTAWAAGPPTTLFTPNRPQQIVSWTPAFPYKSPRRSTRSKLAFPVGRAPGFDPLHIALSGGGQCALSAIASPGPCFINLLKPSAGPAFSAGSGTLDSAMLSNIGLASGSKATATTAVYSFQHPNFSATEQTAAAIFFLTSISLSTYQTILANTNNTLMLLLNPSGLISAYSNGDNAVVAGQVGVPYFFAASGGGQLKINGVVVNLLTGQTYTMSNPLSAGIQSIASPTYLANNTSGISQSMGGYIAAATLISNYLSLQQLLKWAEDPWGFWYPNSNPETRIALLPPSSPASFFKVPRRPRSKFAFPVGRAPGFDSNHVACKGGFQNALSAIPAGADFVNLLTGQPGTVAGSITQNIRNFGPVVSWGSNVITNQVTFPAGYPVTNSGTVACIGRITVVDVSNGFYSQDQSSSAGFTFGRWSSSLVFWKYNVAVIQAPFDVPSGDPFFAAASFNSSLGVNFVLLNLRTGALQSAFVSNTGNVSTGSPTTSVIGGTTGVLQAPDGDIAAIAYLNGPFLSIAELTSWAADPWAFWYPNERGVVAAPTAAVTPIGAFLMNLGVGQYTLTDETETLIKKSLLGVQSTLFTLTGEQLALKKGSLDKLQAGTYSLTGENEALLKGSLTKPQTAFYTLTDMQEVLKKKSIDKIQTVFYTLTGEALSLQIPGNFVMSLGVGFYTLTDEQETLLKKSLDKTQAGTYSLTGENESLLKGSLAKAQAGFYTLTGEQIKEIKTSLGNVQTGFYQLTDENFALLKTSLAKIQTDFYNLTALQEVLKKASLGALQAGFYNLTGESISISVPGAFIMNIAAGNYALTGENVAELKASKMAVQSGSYTFTGETARTLRGAQAAIQAGTYSLTGEPLKELMTHLAHLSPGLYVVTVESLKLVSSGTIIVNYVASPVLLGEEAAATLLGNKVISAIEGKIG